MIVSVIMPCHNCGPWVAEALQSVASQTYPAHEIIVINDNSTDDSVAQIEASGVPVKLLHTQYGNAAAARNEGIRHATGNWVAFLDADDIWSREHLDVAAGTCRQNDVAFFSRFRKLLTDGSIEDDARNGLPIEEPIGGLAHGILCDTLVVPFGGWPTSGMVMNRRRILEIGGFDEELIRRHDAEMLFRVVHGHFWAYSPIPTWQYRCREEGNISSNIPECAYYFLLALTKIRELYGDSRVTQRIRRQARIAAGAAVRKGDQQLTRRVFELAGRDMPLHWRMLFPFCKILVLCAPFSRKASSRW